jgi:hypothetical protein
MRSNTPTRPPTSRPIAETVGDDASVGQLSALMHQQQVAANANGAADANASAVAGVEDFPLVVVIDSLPVEPGVVRESWRRVNPLQSGFPGPLKGVRLELDRRQQPVQPRPIRTGSVHPTDRLQGAKNQARLWWTDHQGQYRPNLIEAPIGAERLKTKHSTADRQALAGSCLTEHERVGADERLPGSKRIEELGVVSKEGRAPRVAAPVLAQPASEPPATPFSRHATSLEFGTAVMPEAWNHNEGPECLFEGSGSMWWAFKKGFALGLEWQHVRVFQATPDAWVQGFSPLFRWRYFERPRWNAYVEVGPGISWSDRPAPPRGTRSTTCSRTRAAS